MKYILYILFACLLYLAPARAVVNTQQYGITLTVDAKTQAAGVAALVDSTLRNNPLVAAKAVVSDVQKPHKYESQTADFYLLLSLCIMLGIIRFVDVRYFYNLWLAFWNPTLSVRQLKDQLQNAGLPNFLMNLFFTITEGAYLYYVVKFYTPGRSDVIPSSLLILMLITGTGIIYLVKYSAVRFSGWAFRVEVITEQYLFNVFLVNKILSVVLVPFIIILAFADREVAGQMVVISFIILGIMLLNRYLRSWQVFGSFFQYSKFHFFMYLCASEILPLAVLMKLLVKGLLFY